MAALCDNLPMIRASLLLASSALALASCAHFDGPGADSAEGTGGTEVGQSAAPAPPPAARTAEEFDTTTPEQRAAATASPARAGAARLGTVIVSLGPPAEPGLWLRTGLVHDVAMGRVENPANGKSVALELRPLRHSTGGTAGGGEISLAAMRLLDVPLVSLPEVVVYRD